VCGKLFQDLGPHIRTKHKIDVKEYRTQFMLAKKSSLISETRRLQLKNNTIKWLEGMTEDERNEIRTRSLEKARQYWSEHPWREQPKIALETKNKRGTCPQQLLEKIREIEERIGHTPSLKRFVYETGGQRYKHSIFTMFGSWNAALKLLGCTDITPARTRYSEHYTKEELIGYMRAYFKIHKKVPTNTDFKRRLLPSRSVYYKNFGSINEARRMASIPYY